MKKTIFIKLEELVGENLKQINHLTAAEKVMVSFSESKPLMSLEQHLIFTKCKAKLSFHWVPPTDSAYAAFIYLLLGIFSNGSSDNDEFCIVEPNPDLFALSNFNMKQLLQGKNVFIKRVNCLKDCNLLKKDEEFQNHNEKKDDENVKKNTIKECPEELEGVEVSEFEMEEPESSVAFPKTIKKMLNL